MTHILPALLDFFVRRVFAAKLAILLDFQFVRVFLLVLQRRVIAVLTDGALKCDYFAHSIFPKLFSYV